MKTQIKLTRAEFEIIGSLANGRTPCEIAQDRNVSKRTIDYHQANIYRKLGVHCLQKAILRARELKFI